MPSTPPATVRLPDGQHFTVTPVFAGLFFKSHELNQHHNPFPSGWTVVLHTEDDPDDGDTRVLSPPSADDMDEDAPPRKTHIHSFKKPTLHGDSLFISSISNPSSNDFKPAASPTRHIAMMLWISLYWYFHQPAPDTILPPTKSTQSTPVLGRPRGEWRINIKRDGVLRGRNLIPKLERMGLIATLDSAVGMGMDDNEGWDHMFVSKRIFWQTPARLFLFTLQPTKGTSSYPGSPISSRPGSPGPSMNESALQPPTSAPQAHLKSEFLGGGPTPATLVSAPSFPIGPFFSSSHLPTYYPPPPLQYTMTNHVRHPVRPKPPRTGEVFYTRFVPSAQQYLAFRVASMSPKPVPYYGPVGPRPPEHAHLTTLSDTSLLQMWLAHPRVQAFWGPYVPNFLSTAMASRHSFPVIGLWDGVPFGFFEVYWVKEDVLGRHLGSGEAGDFDRGLHVFVGEEWARGRVQLWLTSIVHWMFCADYRTNVVCAEPRVDNARFIQHLQYAGFSKAREISFPHKQSWLGKLHRDNWDGPAL